MNVDSILNTEAEWSHYELWKLIKKATYVHDNKKC